MERLRLLFTQADLLHQTHARRAARLLRDGETDLARVAHVTGYRSRPSFCRGFKRELGASPAAYWRSIHKRPFPRQPEGPEKTSSEAEEEPTPSGERTHPSEPE